MENIATLTIHSQEITNEKQKFIASSAEINGRWFKIKFTRECVGAPQSKGLYELTIDFDECSIEKGKTYKDSNGKSKVSNDIIWVRHIVNIRKFTDEELKALNRSEMTKIFCN